MRDVSDDSQTGHEEVCCGKQLQVCNHSRLHLSEAEAYHVGIALRADQGLDCSEHQLQGQDGVSKLRNRTVEQAWRPLTSA